MTPKITKELIDRIFKEPGIRYELTEFETLGRPIHEILSVYPKTVDAGRDAGKTKYYLKSLAPFSSGKQEVQVYVDGGKSAPEEIVRQLWVYKLIQQYGYHADEVDLEKSVQFGTEVGTKAADIIVYTDNQGNPQDYRRVQETQAQGRYRTAQKLHECQGRAGGGLVQRQRQHYPLSPLPQRIR